MKNRILILFLLLTILLSTSCQKNIGQKAFSKIELISVIKDFANRRLLYHLHAKEIPTNHDMIGLILQEKGFDLPSFFQHFQKKNQTLYKSLFEE